MKELYQGLSPFSPVRSVMRHSLISRPSSPKPGGSVIEPHVPDGCPAGRSPPPARCGDARQRACQLEPPRSNACCPCITPRASTASSAPRTAIRRTSITCWRTAQPNSVPDSEAAKEAGGGCCRRSSFRPSASVASTTPAFDDRYTWGDSVEAFMAKANEETVVMVMIETPRRSHMWTKRSAVPGIDALYISTADLSLRLNCFDRWDNPHPRSARVAAAAAMNGIIWGRPGLNAVDIRRLVAAGARLILRGGGCAPPCGRGNSSRAMAAISPRGLGEPVKG